jgi:hypothetical protein
VAPTTVIIMPYAQILPSPPEKQLVSLPENSALMSLDPEVEEPSLMVPLQPEPVPRRETEPRRSVCLKIKGLLGSGRTGTRGYLSNIPGSCPLLDNFSFPRLSVDEISDLFRSYRVVLGDIQILIDL